MISFKFRKKLKIVYLQGGLGNQLFQYSFARALQMRFNCQVKFDLDFFNKGQNRSFCLDKLNLRIIEATVSEKHEAQILKSSFNLKLRKLINRRLILNPVCFEKPLGFNEIYLNKKHKTFYVGYWQSEKYFWNYRDIIRKELSNWSPPSNFNAFAIDAIMEDSNSVSMHIRRGDYIYDQKSNEFHGVCGLNYYKKAFELLSGKIGMISLYVFSDDIEWAKINISFPCKMVFVDWNNDESNTEDLRLMSLCKHNIIANSSFSWWGAWLNNNPNKIVVAPKQWFAKSSDNASSKDIVPNNWIKL